MTQPVLWQCLSEAAEHLGPRTFSDTELLTSMVDTHTHSHAHTHTHTHTYTHNQNTLALAGRDFAYHCAVAAFLKRIFDHLFNQVLVESLSTRWVGPVRRCMSTPHAHATRCVRRQGRQCTRFR
jgi:hypothetical protein